MTNNTITIDASGKILGRLSTEVASKLIGKDRTDFSYNTIPDQKIIITNAKKIVLTGTKKQDKKYYRHSGYLGNLKTISFAKIHDENPSLIIRMSIKNMLPKNRLQAKLLNNLTIYNGEINA